MEETRYRENMQQGVKMLTAARLVSDLRDQVERQTKAIKANSTGGTDATTSDMQQMELDLIVEQWQDAAKRLKALETDRNALPRVRQLHPAIASEWGIW